MCLESPASNETVAKMTRKTVPTRIFASCTSPIDCNSRAKSIDIDAGIIPRGATAAMNIFSELVKRFPIVEI